jgi:hypothetical protein
MGLDFPAVSIGKSFLSGLKIFFSEMTMKDRRDAGSLFVPTAGGFPGLAAGFLSVSWGSGEIQCWVHVL